MDTVDGAAQPTLPLQTSAGGNYEMLFNPMLQLSSPSLSPLMSNGGVPPPPPMPPQTTQPAAPTPTHMTVKCIHCTTQLSYPAGSPFIMCPKCHKTMNPSQPDVNYVNCVGCTTLLSHPPTSVQIQCPKCAQIMDLSGHASQTAVVPSTVNNTTAAAGAAARKTRKKRKDPAAPKRASNAYMIFCKERRAKLKQERPDLPFGKIGATLGELWRRLTPEEKKPYELRASGDRDRYKKEMSHYSATSGTSGKGEKKEKKKKDSGDGDGTPDKRAKLSHSPASAGPDAGADAPSELGDEDELDGDGDDGGE